MTIAFSPDGAYAWVTNFGSPTSGGGSVAQYTVRSNGSLSFNNPPTCRRAPIRSGSP